MPKPASSPRLCLVVEDQALVGMLVEDCLRDIGIEVAGPIASCAAALEWLKDNTPDLALLDFLLSDGPCLELARELRRKGVPFLVVSGFDARQGQSDPTFADAPWLDKPMSEQALAEAVTALAR